jgi:hypothetical protein
MLYTKFQTFQMKISSLTSISLPSYGVVPQLSFDCWPMADHHSQTRAYCSQDSSHQSHLAFHFRSCQLSSDNSSMA